jgi:hypothetical protein
MSQTPDERFISTASSGPPEPVCAQYSGQNKGLPEVAPAQGPGTHAVGDGSFPQDRPVIHRRGARRLGYRILFLISIRALDRRHRLRVYSRLQAAYQAGRPAIHGGTFG